MSKEKRLTRYQVRMSQFPDVIFEFEYDAFEGMGPSLQSAFQSPGGDPSPAILNAPGQLVAIFTPYNINIDLYYALSTMAAQSAVAVLHRAPAPPRNPRKRKVASDMRQESF